MRQSVVSANCSASRIRHRNGNAGRRSWRLSDHASDGRAVTGSHQRRRSATNSETDPHQAAEVYGERYRANPKDADAALDYGQALRAIGQRSQAAAVLEQAAIAQSRQQGAACRLGPRIRRQRQFAAAFDVLGRAHSPDNPDWRILSVQGTTLDKLGRHEEARRYYASALKIVPDEPSVLSNLGMSYVLTKRAAESRGDVASCLCRDPRADARVRQNLALVVGLQGRFAEAEGIVKADLPSDEAAANVAYLKQMLGRKDPRGGKTVPVAALNGPTDPARCDARRAESCPGLIRAWLPVAQLNAAAYYCAERPRQLSV